MMRALTVYIGLDYVVAHLDEHYINMHLLWMVVVVIIVLLTVVVFATSSTSDIVVV